MSHYESPINTSAIKFSSTGVVGSSSFPTINAPISEGDGFVNMTSFRDPEDLGIAAVAAQNLFLEREAYDPDASRHAQILHVSSFTLRGTTEADL